MSKTDTAQLPLEQLRQIRIEKLKKLEELGINPYLSKSNKTHTILEVTSNFVDFENKEEVLSGRIVALRGHGELVFMDIEDFSGKIQVYIKRETLENYTKDLKNIGFDEIKLLDIGDFIEATGIITKTNRGEISIQPKIIKLLTKSLRPLPNRHFGLKDEEERFRQRYVDFNINKDLRDLFVKKSIFWDSIRSFMKSNGFLEVETPVLENTAGGADADPFITHHNALDIDVYLRISMGELWQKRLMVGGFEKTFEIGRQFRNEGISREHLQDYTQMEFYWAYANYIDSMNLVEEMYREVVYKTFGTYKFEINGFEIDFEKPFEKIDYKTSILQNLNVDIESATVEQIKEKLKELKIPFDASFEKARLIDLLWKQVRKKLAGPAFLINHPVEVSPLAKRKENSPKYVERYQVILAGSEMGNGYSELNDPIDQLNRFMDQQKMRDAGDAEAQMADLDFVRALEYGMPPVSGFGVSERFFSFLMNRSVRECVMFPLLRPEEFSLSNKEVIKTKESAAIEAENTGDFVDFSKIPNENSKRFVAVLNKKIPLGKLATALCHMTAGLVAQYTDVSELNFLEYLDGDNSTHPKISHFPFIVLKAENSSQIRKIREEAIKKNIKYNDFTDTMTLGTSENQVKVTKEKKESELEYFGIVLFGNTSELKEFTGKLSLFS